MSTVIMVQNLTGEMQDLVHFHESTMLFDPRKELGRVKEIKLWGAILHTEEGWSTDLGDPLPDSPIGVNFDPRASDTYIAGWSILVIRDIEEARLEYACYELNDGESSGLEPQHWKLGRVDAYHWQVAARSAATVLYEFSGRFGPPLGSGKLAVWASGTVNLEYTTNRCIPLGRYLAEPKLFGHHRARFGPE